SVVVCKVCGRARVGSTPSSIGTARPRRNPSGPREATQFGTLLSADYGADGLRAWKQNAGGVSTYFLYDGVTPILELDATGAIKATNAWGANGLTSRRDALGSDTFYTFDERGNVSERTNGTGQVLTRHIADAYGNTSAYDAGGAPLAQVPNPYSGFGGKYGYYTDGETGLILCTFRYYDSQTGRWLNEDPIGYAGGINIYAYCSGNPINWIDPSGLQDDLPDSEIGGMKGGIRNRPGLNGGANGQWAHSAIDELWNTLAWGFAGVIIPGSGAYDDVARVASCGGKATFRELLSHSSVATKMGTEWGDEVLKLLGRKGAKVTGEFTQEAMVNGKRVVGNFDGAVGNTWIEFKSGWGKNPQKDMQQILNQARVAREGCRV
ncbi:MAG: RHS repeat-associated core domain-containing protein, partial [Fibrella sp.]|nr:RHS repeat-associated core domain-containing protein [Armatimonadota bacterium]